MIKKSCLLLFSGGLDSILTAKILQAQGIKIIPICFKSYFFDCQTAQKSARKLDLKLKVIDFSQQHLKIIQNPKFGRGKGLNPCLDCHLLMLKQAKKLLIKKNYDFVATGEVLGERPFSQNLKALRLLEEKSGLKGKLLRPLSAKLLPPTEPENKGLVKRKNLFAIEGRSRKIQLELAKNFGFKDFPTPAGGCILTDKNYSARLNQLWEKIPQANGRDAQLLRLGRVFWRNEFLLVVGRNEKENQQLEKLKKETDLLLIPDFPGPTVLIRGFGKKIKKDVIEKARKLILQYSKKLPPVPQLSFR